MSLAEINIAADKYGFYKITDKATRNTRWGISCADCKVESTKGWPPSTSPELMVKNMRAMGWDVSKHNQPVCADCLRRHTRGPARVAPPLTVVGNEEGGGPKTQSIGTVPTSYPLNPVTEQAHPFPVEPAAAPPSVKTQRKVFAFLEAYFDDKSRLYRGGYTDERVALECETDTAVVVGIREEAFGTLAEPPEWMQLRTDMITVSHDIDVLESALLDHISGVVDPLKKRLQKMQDRLNAITNKGTQG